ncbi:MAG TPA: sulfatase-like hydrolase/transferase, partial [Candidatus Hydrogenedentes bacterium]|nr:sulfatase-like hydrolase/transferase [Candidatus Hydrogenedentota bacterium]
ANNERGHAEGNGMETPSDAPYSDEAWPQPQKNHAAMITRLDRDVGRVLDRVRERGLAEDTLVFFSSDNGPHKEAGAAPNFFRSSGPVRGIKRDLYDGGIRVPFIVWGPSAVPAGATSDHVCAFWDFLPTAAELAGTTAPPGLDGVSFAPTLLDAADRQRRHEFLYWEFHEGGFNQAVRIDHWKIVRPGTKAPIEVYDVASDIGETRDLAADQPGLVRRAEALFRDQRTDSAEWPVPQR